VRWGNRGSLPCLRVKDDWSGVGGLIADSAQEHSLAIWFDHAGGQSEGIKNKLTAPAIALFVKKREKSYKCAWFGKRSRGDTLRGSALTTVAFGARPPVRESKR